VTRKASGHPAPSPLASIASELRYGLEFIRRHPWRLLLPFVGVLLPLWAFAGLASEMREDGFLFFDIPTMVFLHQWASPRIDAFFSVVSRIGYLWGVVPANVLILLWLVLRRRYRDGLFFGLAVVGSLAVNLAAKNYFARVRPELWLSIAPENSYSFPSGHAMGSVSLGVAATLLCWHSRWRWPVFIAASGFILLVGMSRIYLGVHYPSDILAGWAAAMAWVVAMYHLVVREAPKPKPAAGAGEDLITRN
jgi:membrane-associated phospholipid phosphatase